MAVTLICAGSAVTPRAYPPSWISRSGSQRTPKLRYRHARIAFELREETAVATEREEGGDRVDRVAIGQGPTGFTLEIRSQERRAPRKLAFEVGEHGLRPQTGHAVVRVELDDQRSTLAERDVEVCRRAHVTRANPQEHEHHGKAQRNAADEDNPESSAKPDAGDRGNGDDAEGNQHVRMLIDELAPGSSHRDTSEKCSRKGMATPRRALYYIYRPARYAMMVPQITRFQVSRRLLHGPPEVPLSCAANTGAAALLRAVSGRRRAELLVGRWCAAEALRLAGNFGSNWLDMRPDGGPDWPVGFIGSITHTGDIVVAAAESSSRLRSLGIDAERRVAPERVARLRSVVATPLEQTRWFQRGGPFPPCECFSLLFSVKESFYKCLRPLVDRFIDFQDVEITRIDPEAELLTLRIAVDLDPEFRRGAELTGRFAWFEDHVLTAVELECPPEGLLPCASN